MLTNSSAHYDGGGSYEDTLNNCVFVSNSADENGGGAYESVFSNSKLIDNLARGDDTGGRADSCTLTKCLVAGNSATGSACGGGASYCRLDNCTITDNSATRTDSTGGTSGCTLTNCIVYINPAPTNANYSGGTIRFSCFTSMPTNGISDISNVPPVEVWFPSSADRLCTLESARNLENAVWTNVPGQGPRAGVSGPDFLTDTNAAPERFYRLMVQLP